MSAALRELRRYRKRVIIALLIMVGGTFTWAITTDLEKGVHLMGRVVPDTRRKVVQAQVAGIIRQIHAKDGQELNEGDPILTIDTEKLVAEIQATERRLAEGMLTRERLRAEMSGKSFRPDLKAYSAKFSSLDNSQLLALAEATMKASLGSQSAQIAMLDARIAKLQAEAVSLKAEAELLAKQQVILDDRIERLKPMVDAGLYARADYSRQEQQSLDLRTQVETRLAAERSTRLDEQSARAERERTLQDSQFKAAQTVSSAEVDVQQTASKLTQLVADLQSAVIRAPARGQLVTLSTTTTGGMVQIGQTIAQIVPKDEPLLIEAGVDPMNMERMKAGIKAEVRFVAMPRKGSPLLQGKVLYVTRDVVTDSSEAARSARQQEPAYQVRVAIDASELHKLGGFEVVAGMPVEIFTDGGSRSVLDYFVSPVTQLFERAMREQ